MNRENQFVGWQPYRSLNEGMNWPDGQALPSFATPEELDTFTLYHQPDDVKNTLTVMQGLINRKKTRIFLNGIKGKEEGADHWPTALHLHRNEKTTDVFAFIAKYQHEFGGVVVYDGERSPHMVNLAGTIAGLQNLLPVDVKFYQAFAANGIELKILVDLTTLQFENHVEMYQYMYDTYWEGCTKRVMVSVDPVVHHAYIRDMAAAVGAAVVWLDARIPEEAAMLHRFLDDMTAGESILLGWWPEERSGIGAGTRHGISTIPSDYYDNATVYAGMSHILRIPTVPKKQRLENKVYIAIFLSDGDNVQYCQHHMSILWRDPKRGTIPINWTISPGLADIGPGLLNYYYDTITENDCMCSGPSGLGYALIYDSHNEVYYLQDGELANAYAKFSEQYLAKTGIRVITVWDVLREIHFDAYATHCRTLYGVTLEDWFRKPAALKIHVEQNKLTFAPNYPAYAETCDDIYNHMKEAIATFDGTKPLFLSGQGVSWSMTAENLAELKQRFEDLQPGKIEFVRADHFFALHNEANGVPFNLALSPDVKVTASDSTCHPAKVINGSPSGDNVWSSKNPGAWVSLDLGAAYSLTRYTLKNAEFSGMDASLNTVALKLEVSLNGKDWTLVDEQTGNEKAAIDVNLDPVKARYARLTVIDPGADGVTRLADLELYGIA
ncbi:discoidin domain-containing protein [Alicyclobacillus fodiniaquatilis]|uniref:Discoidin domain-containing protein n=1 Tax=Alicyclobacillus fodiniaquatilis TaxID=1661150 RepID=A0ABW4JA83_9BACL